MRLAAWLLISVSLVTPSAAGADFNLTGSLSWVDPMGDEDDHPSIDFDSELGFGAALNVFWSERWSTEFAVYSVEPDLIITEGEDFQGILDNTAIGINAISVTAIVQYHFRVDRRWSSYVGAGAAYALFDDINDAGDLDDLDLRAINFDDDAGLALNGGVNWNFHKTWRLNLDAKYTPVESEANIQPAEGQVVEASVGYSPLILSVGLSLRF